MSAQRVSVDFDGRNPKNTRVYLEDGTEITGVTDIYFNANLSGSYLRIEIVPDQINIKNMPIVEKDANGILSETDYEGRPRENLEDDEL